MIGNAWEWVEDCLNATYSGAPDDGSAWLSGNCDLRVLQGRVMEFGSRRCARGPALPPPETDPAQRHGLPGRTRVVVAG